MPWKRKVNRNNQLNSTAYGDVESHRNNKHNSTAYGDFESKIICSR